MTKKLWGGRFKKAVDPVFERFSQRLSKCLVVICVIENLDALKFDMCQRLFEKETG